MKTPRRKLTVTSLVAMFWLPLGLLAAISCTTTGDNYLRTKRITSLHGITITPSGNRVVVLALETLLDVYGGVFGETDTPKSARWYVAQFDTAGALLRSDTVGISMVSDSSYAIVSATESTLCMVRSADGGTGHNTIILFGLNDGGKTEYVHPDGFVEANAVWIPPSHIVYRRLSNVSSTVKSTIELWNYDTDHKTEVWETHQGSFYLARGGHTSGPTTFIAKSGSAIVRFFNCLAGTASEPDSTLSAFRNVVAFGDTCLLAYNDGNMVRARWDGQGLQIQDTLTISQQPSYLAVDSAGEALAYCADVSAGGYYADISIRPPVPLLLIQSEYEEIDLR